MPRLGATGLKGGATNAQPRERKAYARASLFDAVAGRIGSSGFIQSQPRTSKYRDTISLSTEPIPPEAVLFRQKGRAFLDELDPYWADKKLTEDQQLPDSDLLKALHAYVSDFYFRTFGEQAQIDFYSFDETALLCLGMLLEEMTDEKIGTTGDLALTEGEVIDTVEHDEMPIDVSEEEASISSLPAEPVMDAMDSPPHKPRRSKKRKLKHEAEET